MVRLLFSNLCVSDFFFSCLPQCVFPKSLLLCPITSPLQTLTRSNPHPSLSPSPSPNPNPNNYPNANPSPNPNPKTQTPFPHPHAHIPAHPHPPAYSTYMQEVIDGRGVIRASH